jgi:hypothetical protein
MDTDTSLVGLQFINAGATRRTKNAPTSEKPGIQKQHVVNRTTIVRAGYVLPFRQVMYRSWVIHITRQSSGPCPKEDHTLATANPSTTSKSANSDNEGRSFHIHDRQGQANNAAQSKSSRHGCQQNDQQYRPAQDRPAAGTAGSELTLHLSRIVAEAMGCVQKVAPTEWPAARHFGASTTYCLACTGTNHCGSQCKRVTVASDGPHPLNLTVSGCPVKGAVPEHVHVTVALEAESFPDRLACSQHTSAACISSNPLHG